MPYLIDGHNVIAQSSDLALGEPDVEARLAERVRRLCARRATSATIYFDRGRRGAGRPPATAGVTVRFIVPPDSADAAILRHLERLGKVAPNWTVVSSDGEIVRAARRARARTLPSREFAALLDLASSGDEAPEKPSGPDTESEIDRWEAEFRRRRPPG